MNESIQTKKIEIAEALRKKICQLDKELKATKESLFQLESSCCHQWEDPVYCPEYRKGYTIPGDPPGTMGSDWRGPVDVPAQTIKRWRRKCKLCGKEEITERVKEVSHDEPSF